LRRGSGLTGILWKRFGKSCEPEFAGRIGCEAPAGAAAGSRRNIDDVACALFLHYREGSATNVDRPEQVDVDHVLPLFAGEAFDATGFVDDAR
jgi:hypothetical protein